MADLSFARITLAWQRFWQPIPEGIGLDALLAQANPKDPFAERLRWLAKLCRSRLKTMIPSPTTGRL